MRGSSQQLNQANPYLYAQDDPVNVTDPSGKDAILCAVGIIATLFFTIPSFITLIAAVNAFAFYLATNFTVLAGFTLFAGILSFEAVLGIAIVLGLLVTIGFIAAVVAAIYPCFQ